MGGFRLTPMDAKLLTTSRTRVPFLFKAMVAVAIPQSGAVTRDLLPPLAACYGILMKQRYHNLSAFHRLTTTIATKGGLDETAQTRLNHLGLLLSSKSRLRLQDAAMDESQKLIACHLKTNPLIKLTGDNLDIYVRTSHESSERHNKDLHLFTSNVIFSRIATTDMSDDPPKVEKSALTPDDVLLVNSAQKEQMVDAYGILLGRIICRMPSFSQLKKCLTSRIKHQYSQKMAEKSIVLPLPILFKNEGKHSDCLDIMDSYEHQLSTVFEGAFGDDDLLHKYKVPVGGDQLTRVRLREAKNLRTLAVTPEKRLEDLHPIVCEMWHTKQDFLEKCYKTFYKEVNSPGTLYFFKTILHRTAVNGKVKTGRFQSHHDLLIAVGEGLLTEQMLEFFEMEDPSSDPQHPLLKDLQVKSSEEQCDIAKQLIKDFMAYYGYGSLGKPLNVEIPDKGAQIYRVMSIPGTNVTYVEKVPREPDSLFNYAVNLCHWALHMMELDDTAKEGDLTRLVLNCKYNTPFFYSHSHLSKYMVENIDFVLKTEYLLSPLQRMRVLEGSFVNVRGGSGNNVESDLVQEHSVCNQKSLIKTLGANKSEKAISRVTGAANSIVAICDKFDESIKLKPKSSRHSKHLSANDERSIYTNLRKLRPFRYTPGRKCPGFDHITATPISPRQLPAMKSRIQQIINRLTRGISVTVDEEAEELDRDYF